MSNRLFARVAIAGALSLGLACAAFAQSATKEPLVANAADSTFMTRAAADGIAEVQMGQMALDKSSDTEVKKLAQRIVDDHTKANASLRNLAQAKQVSLPSAPTDDAQKAAGSMKKMDGKDFDQAWADSMVKDHQKAIAMFTTESKQTQDADLRKFTSGTLPTLQAHLETARQVQDHLGVAKVRDKVMGNNAKAMDDDSFDHANPAAAATAATTATTPTMVMPATSPTMTPAPSTTSRSH
jgi:putative membrane protein